MVGTVGAWMAGVVGGGGYYLAILDTRDHRVEKLGVIRPLIGPMLKQLE